MPYYESGNVGLYSGGLMKAAIEWSTSLSETALVVNYNTRMLIYGNIQASGFRLTGGYNRSGDVNQIDTGDFSLNSWPGYVWWIASGPHGAAPSFGRERAAYSVRVYSWVNKNDRGAAQVYSDWITVPALDEAATPGAPTVSGSGNTRTVTCPAVSYGKTYTLYRMYDGWDWVSLGNVPAGTPLAIELNPNSAVYFRYTAVGPNGVVKTGATSPVQYTTPAKPDGLTAATVDTMVNLAWSLNATYATSITIRRSSQPDMSNPVVIYNGAPKSAHTDEPPPGFNYYQVCANGPAPYGSTEWSNIAEAVTMIAPDAPTGFTRAAGESGFDSNEIALRWQNNPSTIAPYSATTVEVSDNEEDWLQIHSSSGELSGFTYPTEPAMRLWFRIKAGNAAGESEWVYAGPFYTNLPVLEVVEPTIEVDDAVVVSVDWGFNTELPEPTNNINYDIQVSTSIDEETWTTWQTWKSSDENYIDYGVTSGKLYVKFRAQATLMGWDNGERVSEWGETDSILVAHDPEQAIVTYDKETLTAHVSIPKNEWAHVSPSIVSLYVNNELFHRWTVNGGEAQRSIQVIPPAARFTLRADTENDFATDVIRGADLTVDFDTVRANIDGTRYVSAFVYETGEVVQCGMALIE